MEEYGKISLFSGRLQPDCGLVDQEGEWMLSTLSEWVLETPFKI